MLPLRDENPVSITPFVTWTIIALCVIAYFAIPNQFDSAGEFHLQQAAIPCELSTGEALSAAEQQAARTPNPTDDVCVDGDGSDGNKIVWLAAIASVFLHGGLMHLGGNMWFLWIFGNNVEDKLGHFWFGVFYLAGGIAATLGHVLAQPDSLIPVVGASGAIAAVMGAYLVWFPDAPIRTIVFLILFDIRARWFLAAWFIFQFFTAPDSRVAWVAHVAGFIFGVIVGALVRIASRPENDPIDVSIATWDPTGGAGRGPYRHPSDVFGDDRSFRG